MMEARGLVGGFTEVFMRLGDYGTLRPYGHGQ
jgi:hypothetical protein